MKILRMLITVSGGLMLTIGLMFILILFSVNLPGSLVLAGGSNRYVATTGSDAGNDCLDSNNPCATVQYAVDMANDGDEIQVAEGTYTETVVLNKGLSLVGAGQALTLISGGGTSSVIQVQLNTTSVISGMTILNGQAYYGGGVFNNGNLQIIDAKITENTAEIEGGGITN